MKKYPSWSSGIPGEELVVPMSCEWGSTVSIQALCKVFMLSCIGQWLQWISPDQYVLEITSLHLFCWKQLLGTISFSSRRSHFLDNYKLDNLQIRERGFFPSVSVHSLYEMLPVWQELLTELKIFVPGSRELGENVSEDNQRVCKACLHVLQGEKWSRQAISLGRMSYTR